jgi:hypothetical protein
LSTRATVNRLVALDEVLSVLLDILTQASEAAKLTGEQLRQNFPPHLGTVLWKDDQIQARVSHFSTINHGSDLLAVVDDILMALTNRDLVVHYSHANSVWAGGNATLRHCASLADCVAHQTG